MRGKKLATVTPTCALAEAICCSACRMSGRRSSSSDGSPGGVCGGTASCVSMTLRWYFPGLASEQDADLVLLDDDLLLELRDGGGGAAQGRPGALDRQQRVDPALVAAREQGLGLGERLGGAARDLELEIELLELEVRLRDAADQRQHDAAPEVLGGEQVGDRRLGGAADAAPDVDLPGQVEAAEEDVEGLVVDLRSE